MMVTCINARNANMGGENPGVKSVVVPVSANMGVKNPIVKSVADPVFANMGGENPIVKSVVDPVSANMGVKNPSVPIVLLKTHVQPVDTSLSKRPPVSIPSVPGVTM